MRHEQDTRAGHRGATGGVVASVRARPAGSGGNATWRDRADDEDGYRVYARHAWTTPACEERRGKFRRIDTLPPDTQPYRPTHRQVIRRLPQRRDVWRDRHGESPVANEIHVEAFNEAGESKRVEAGSYSFGLFECGFDV